MQMAERTSADSEVSISGEVTIEAVTDHAVFLGLAPAWDALAAQVDPSSFFLRHDWAAAAWAWREREGRPLVLLVRDCGELIGIIPLLEDAAGTRRATLAWLAVPDNQEADLVAPPAERARVAGALARWLAAHRSRWSRLALTQIPVDSPSLPALCAALESRGMPVRTERSGTNYAIELDGTWEDFYRTRSRRLKKGNNLVANRLRRAGSIELVRLSGDQITAAVGQTLRSLSASSWKQATATTFDRPAPGAFLDTLITRGQGGDWLVAWLLHLDGEPIASELHIEHGGRAHALRADYAEHAAELSPGTYLNWKVIEQLFDSDLRRYELGPGANPYKQRWTEGGIALATLDAWPPTAAGRMAALWTCRLRPAAARLRDQLRRPASG